MITPEFIAALRGKAIGPDVVALLDEVEMLQAEVLEFKKWVVSIDRHCKAARPWTEQCILQTARIESARALEGK